MSDTSSEPGELTDGLFQEPDDFYEPEKQPTFVKHRMLNGEEISLRLVGHNPLWGHLLWNAGRILANYFETNATTLVKDKTVLEVGAGAGLPSLMSAIHDAKKVVVTDYPDAALVENLQYNIDHSPLLTNKNNIVAEGYLWGDSPTILIAHLNEGVDARFDLLILADVLFNHSEHTKLLSSIQQTLKREKGAQALVFFTPYRPWLLEKDLAFFDLAREGGFVVEKIMETVMDKVMFEEDRGDELLRRTVFGYCLHWTEESLQAS